jgi:hypothetical protein
MAARTSDELSTIGAAEELEIAVRHEGHVRAGGVDKEVVLVETDDVNDEVDAKYRTKYRRYAASISDHMTSPEARAATLKLVPR